MNLLALTVLVAAASEEQALRVVFPSVTFPEAFATVPTNVRPIVFGPTGEDVTLVRVTGARDVELETTELAPGIFTASPGELTAGERLVLEAHCASCDSTGIEWTVGESRDDVTPAFGEGAAADIDILGFHSGGPFPTAAGYELGMTLPGVDEAVVVILESERQALLNDACCRQNASTDRLPVHAFIDGGEERTECFRARAIDVAGNETEFRDELCFELTHELMEEPVWCGQSSTLPLPLAVLALGLAQRRRRSRA